MHEMALAAALHEQTLRSIEGRGSLRVDEIEIEVGVLQMIVPEALEACWDAVCVQTSLEGSRLTVVETPARAECRACGAEFQPEVDCYLCAACGQASVRITGGNDVVLKAIACESEA